MPAFNASDFSGNPVRLSAPRSKFAMPFKHKTTFNAGLVIPVFSYGDILPGDTFSVDMSSLVRMSTPVFPTMDDAYLDVYWFFTPHKLTLSRRMMSPDVNDSNYSWAAFIGAQDSLLNMPVPSDNLLPFVWIDKGGSEADLGSLTDYLGLGLSYGQRGINVLEPLAYYSVFNSYFRDENTQNPVCYSLGGAYSGSASSDPNLVGRRSLQITGYDGTNRWGAYANSIGYVGSILPACRPHGYFGSALPWPQRNSTAVTLPLGDIAPVYASSTDVITNANIPDDIEQLKLYGLTSSPSPLSSLVNGAVVDALGNVGIQTDTGDYSNSVKATPVNLVADLKNASAASVNALRYAFAQQKWYEALARGGNRIGEITASMFGVTPSDLAQDRPEYLGGKRIPISMDQVANTAGPGAGGSGQTLGSLGAYSNTGDSSHYFTKSFDTWGTLQCMIVVRTNESFCQGIARRYTRKSRMEFYWPQFANIGEQPVLAQEIYMGSGYDASEKAVFGYQEAWAEYRYLPDIVSGHLRPNKDLGSYTYGNNFASSPTLAGYLKGDGVKANIDRTLVVPSTTAGFQFIGDFAFNIVATRAMPRYSIPGLIDHY